jgi:hypothetical protein
VNRNRLAAGDGGEDPIDGLAHPGEQERIVELGQRRRQELPRRRGVVETTLAQQPRDHVRDAHCRRRRGHARVVAGHVFPDASNHQLDGSAASSTKAWPAAPIARNFW